MLKGMLNVPSTGTSAQIRTGTVPTLFATAAGAWLALLVWLHLRLRDLAFDDAYIHLRIARNLLRHGRAFFNPGERVMATSSPLWTVLLAVFRVPNHAAVLPVAEAVVVWVCGLLAFWIGIETLASMEEGRRVWRPVVGLGAAVLVTVLLLSSSLGQMETPLAIALLLGAWLCATRMGWGTLPLLALAACTRLELLPLLLLACVVWLLRRKSVVPVAIAAVVVMASAAWTELQFGVLLPNSIHAKRVVYNYTVRRAAQQFVSGRLRDELPFAALLLFVALALGMEWFRGRRGLRDGGSVLPLTAVGWGVLVCLQYAANRTVLFDWYRPLFTVPLALGLLLHVGDADAPRFLRVSMAVCRGVTLVGLAALPLWLAGRAMRAAVHPTPLAKGHMDAGDSARVQAYRQLGSVLRAACPGGRLMTPEIGALGWEFDGYVYDSFGIASPGALHYQPLTSGASVGGVPAGYVLSTLPDLIVSYSMLDTEVRGSDELRARYRLLALPPSARGDRGGALDAGWRGSRNLDVWLRRDGVCPVPVVAEAVRGALE